MKYSALPVICLLLLFGITNALQAQIQSRVLSDRLFIKGENLSDQGSFFSYEMISLVGTSPTAGAFEATPTSLFLSDGIGSRGEFLAEPNLIRFRNFDNLTTNDWLITHLQSPGSTSLQFISQSISPDTAYLPLQLFPDHSEFMGLVKMNSPLEIQSTVAGNASLFIGVGSGASATGGFNLTGVGYNSLRNNLDGAGENTALGAYSLQNNTSGSLNTAVGSSALSLNSTGFDNTSIGAFSLQQNTNGAANIAIGAYALQYVNAFDNVAIGNRAYSGVDSTTASGSENTAVGSFSLEKNNIGASNVAIGFLSLRDNTSGNQNTAAGSYSLSKNTEGVTNTAIGHNALLENTTGNNNVGLGAFSLEKNTDAGGSTGIGHQALRNVNAFDNVAVGESAYSGVDSTTSSGSENTAIGGFALNYNQTGNQNTALGFLSLRESVTGSENTSLGAYSQEKSTSGNRNVSVGNNALRYSNGDNNVAIGHQALEGADSTISTGIQNTALGNNSLRSITTGSSNVGIGFNAMSNSTTAFNNTAVGTDALSALESNGDNAAFGTNALGNTTGGSNSAFGSFAMAANTTGSFNAALGYFSLSSNTTGSFNSAVGYAAFDADTTTAYENSTALGYDAEPGGSNTIRLGNDAVTTIAGVVDFTTTSDARFKHKVKEDVPGMDFINELRPVTYHLDAKAMDNWRAKHLGQRDSSDYGQKGAIEQIKFSGFLAQEVEEAAEKVGYDFSGVDKPDTEQQAYGLRYGSFVVPLVKATQEQQEEIRDLKSEVRRLKSEVGNQRSENEALRQELDNLKDLVQQLLDGHGTENAPVILDQAPSLDQNEPNPFTDQSSIGYFLPEGTTKAELIITGIDGKELQRVSLAQKGKGSVQIQTRNFPAGTYNYSLVINGQIVDTKRMVIQR